VFIALCFSDSAGTPVEQAQVHRELHGFLDAHRRALVELPRDHGKTFQICGRIIWELGNRPGLRVKVVCATEAVAAERSRFLRDAIAGNPCVRKVFPHLEPAEPWAADAFTVKRPAEVVGPSVAAFGVGAGSTGTRADLLVCDDVVDVKALTSRAERDRAAAFFHDNLLNLLEPDGRFWGLCTPWHPDDLNARLKRNPAFRVFRRAVGEDLEPVWPAKWPRERLAERRAEIGTASFARGYRLLPVADGETAVRPEWVRYWTDPAEYEATVLSVDPAVSAKATADASALVVLGKTGEPGSPAPGFSAARTEIHVLEATARRVAAPELVALIDAADRRWNPGVILFEQNAAFQGIKDLLVRHARFGPRVKGITQSADKAARVAGFSVAVENGAFRLRGDGRGRPDPGQQALYDELVTFPFGDHDDLLDAAATGTAHLLDRRPPRVW
jgi:predicted phage terminase large subunit-like protein